MVLGRKEKISWADRVRNKEVIYSFNEERHILQIINKGRLNGLVIP
jgi:hypothetical protein